MRTITPVRRLAEAVVAVLRALLSQEARQQLATIQLKEWESSYHWLDANGLTLYLRSAIRSVHLEPWVLPEVLSRLDQSYTDNQLRIESQLIEFRLTNQRFQGAGIRYANLKGFTLEPAYCPNIALRHQCDLDFLVSRADRHTCRLILEDLGYRLVSEGEDTLEFKPREEHIPDIVDLYKPRPQQGVEVHFGSPREKLDLREDCLDRIVSSKRFGMSFPCLSEQDMFFSHTFHLYRHLLSEWIRLSWFYEFGGFLQSRGADVVFWSAVRDRAETDPETRRALALVLAFSKLAFTSSLPKPLETLCSANLGKSTELWIHHYGSEMLFSDFPGNKLYLLLLRELDTLPGYWQQVSRRRLLPLHAPPRALYGDSWVERIKHTPGNARYGLSRARFHAREGLRYLREQWRWKRRLEQAALLESGTK